MNEEIWRSHRTSVLGVDTQLWSTSPYFPGWAGAHGGNRRRSNMGESKSEARLRRISMSNHRSFVSADQFHPDPYTQSRTAERTLNSAIVHAEITRSYEEYLEIFDAFYADDVEGSSETMEEPIRGKARVRSLLFSFLVPLHAMAKEKRHIIKRRGSVGTYGGFPDLKFLGSNSLAGDSDGISLGRT